MTSSSDTASLARQAVGGTSESRARWLLKFSQLDFQNLELDEVTRVRVETAVFLGSDLHLRKSDGSLDQSQLPTRDEAKQWQRELKQRIESLKQGQQWSIQPVTRIILQLADGKLTVSRPMTPLTTERFTFKALQALVNVREHVRQCARQDCKRLFIGTENQGRPQTYCSATCRGTVNTRKYRQHHP